MSAVQLDVKYWILNNMPKKLQKLAVTFGNSLRIVESANWRAQNGFGITFFKTRRNV